MAGLAVVLIILGCAAFQYFKGTLVKALATLIISICASVVAFGYFEALANIIISHISEGRFASLLPWAHSLCFVLLFILTFAGLQTAASQLMRQPVDLGLIPERVGRIVCGILLGLVSSGVLLTALAMAPLPNNYPYQRFVDPRTPDDAQNPSKVFLNADGFAAGWFSMISNGSFRPIINPKSFAALRPDFLDQLFLNRHNIADGVPLVTSSLSIEVPRKNGAWFAPEGLKDSSGNPVISKSGHNIVIVRMGIKGIAVKDAGQFTLSQIRLICKSGKAQNENPFIGKGKNAYPIGYLKAANQLQEKKLTDQITITREDFTENQPVKWIDFAFYVPNDSVPAFLEFKLNNLVEVPPPVSADQAPPPAPFIERSTTAVPSGQSPAPTDRSGGEPGRRGLSNISKGVLGPGFDDDK
jgi:hypothetical protein